MGITSLWGRGGVGRRSVRKGEAAWAAEVLEERQLLSAVDIAGFTDTSAWRIGASDENGFEFTTVQQWSRGVEWFHPVTGDFNGDGIDDVAARTQFGEWWVGLNDGAGHLTTGLWTQWDPSKFWIESLVGDFDGDGDDDIAGLTKEVPLSSSSVFGQRVQDGWVALSNGDDGFVDQHWATWSRTNWQEIGVGDFNGDGRDDIAAFEGQGSDNPLLRVALPATFEWWVALSDGTQFLSSAWTRWSSRPWKDISFGDFNGDGRDDIAGRTDEGQWWVALAQSGGGFVNRHWTTWGSGQDWRDVVVGDFDADGNDDIAGRTRSGQWWVARSTADSRFTNELWGTWNENLLWRHAVVGDFNDDGRDDIAAQGWTREIPLIGTGQPWWVAKSTGLAFVNELWATEPLFTTYERVLAGEFDTERD